MSRSRLSGLPIALPILLTLVLVGCAPVSEPVGDIESTTRSTGGATPDTTYLAVRHPTTGPVSGFGLPVSYDAQPFDARGLADPTIGQLLIDQADGTVSCTGTVVSSEARNIVLTAAHCLGYATDSSATVRFIPGANDDELTARFGVWYGTEVVLPNTYDAGSLEANSDIAFVVLGPDEDGRLVQDITGGQGLLFGADQTSGLVVVGYPGGNLRYMCSPGTDDTRFSETSIVRVDCSLGQGSSGGPWLVFYDADAGAGYIAGVTSTTTDDGLIRGTALAESALILFNSIGGGA